MKFTKKEMLNAFLLFLDEALPQVECKRLKQNGNADCPRRCDLCMVRHYLARVRAGKTPKAARENAGRDYPTIE